MAVKSVLNERWSKLSASHKQFAVVGGLIAVFLIGSLVIAGPSPVRPKREKKPQDLANVLTSADPKELGITGLAREVNKIREDMKTQQDEQAKDHALGTTPTATATGAMPEFPGADPYAAALPAAEAPETAQMRAELEALRAQVRTLEQQPPQGMSRGNAGGRNSRNDRDPPTPLVIQTIEDDADAGLIEVANAPAPVKPMVYLPSGSLLSGALIYGVDAATGRSAQSNPLPVLVRLKHDAILPSHQRLNVDTCHAMASCYGDLASERAYCRATSFSCILDDGSVIDQAIEMIAIGSDGKAGLRGRVVSKKGAAIGKAALAGLADGVAEAFSGNQNAGYSAAGVDPGAALGSGAYNGASSALDRIAQYWLEQADRMSEVIEIDAGRQVTFATVRGSELALANH